MASTPSGSRRHLSVPGRPTSSPSASAVHAVHRGPARDEHGHGQSGDAARQVEQEAQRGGVGRVGIVNGEHQRPGGGHVHRQPVHAVHQRGRVSGVGGRPWTGLEKGQGGGRRTGEEPLPLVLAG